MPPVDMMINSMTTCRPSSKTMMGAWKHLYRIALLVGRLLSTRVCVWILFFQSCQLGIINVQQCNNLLLSFCVVVATTAGTHHPTALKFRCHGKQED